MGRHLKEVPPPAMGRDSFHYPRLVRIPSSLALDTRRDGESRLGRWERCPAHVWAVVMGQKHFLTLSQATHQLFTLLQRISHPWSGSTKTCQAEILCLPLPHYVSGNYISTVQLLFLPLASNSLLFSNSSAAK